MSYIEDNKKEYSGINTRLKPFMLIIFDIILIFAILIVYALVQHVIPSHYLDGYQSKTTEVPDVVITSVPMVTSTPSSETVSLSDKFSDKFSSEVETGNNYYRSPNISVEITEHDGDGQFEGNQRWFVADIYISDISYFQTYMHDGSNKQIGNGIRSMSAAVNSVVAINGDYAIISHDGVIIRNGKIYREVPAEAEICVLFNDGTMECYSADEYDSQAVLERGAWQAWSFGPSLLDSNGNALSSFSSYYGNLACSNPRTVIGYYEPGHYCFVLIDGRQPGYADGLDMVQTASIMESLGCKLAFNLDGGKSSQMTFKSELVNHPYNEGRFISDILYIVDPSSEEIL